MKRGDSVGHKTPKGRNHKSHLIIISTVLLICLISKIVIPWDSVLVSLCLLCYLLPLYICFRPSLLCFVPFPSLLCALRFEYTVSTNSLVLVFPVGHWEEGEVGLFIPLAS